jgi:hypothetical protein
VPLTVIAWEKGESYRGERLDGETEREPDGVLDRRGIRGGPDEAAIVGNSTGPPVRHQATTLIEKKTIAAR